MSNHRFSKYCFWAIAVTVIVLRLLEPRWATYNVTAVLSWDVMGYYLYLPSIFIYNDLAGLAFIPEIMDIYRPTASFYQAFPAENGNMVMKYPIGLSVFYLPFFLIGHLFAKIAGYPADGFSAPYQFAVAMSAIFYNLVALWVLRKLLIKWFKDIAAGLALILLAVGTNYMQYVIYDGAMPHGYLFFLYAMVLYCTYQWYQKPQVIYGLFLGILIGWAAVCRPTDVLVALIPILWGVGSFKDFKQNLVRFQKYYDHLLVAVFMVALTVAPQIIYWKTVAGVWVSNRYEEHFDWFQPHFLKVLFGFEKGWLIYTPLIGLSLIGFYFLYKKDRKLFVPVLVFFAINLYVICSWSAWKYAGSYSCRALVQSYAILAIPLAAFFEAFSGWSYRKIVAVPIVLLVALNLFQLWQYNQGIINAEGNSKAYYFRIFGKTSVSQEDFVLIHTKEAPSRSSDLIQKSSRSLNFEPDTTNNPLIDTTVFYQGKGSFRLSPEQAFSPAIEFPADKIGSYKKAWIKVSVWIFKPGYADGCLIVSGINNSERTLKWTGVPTQTRFTRPGEWQQHSYYYSIPDNLKPDDALKVYLWNTSPETVLLDELKVDIFERE